MTLVDLHDAIQGFYELEHERNENYLEGVRLIAYYAAAPHLNPKKSKIKKPEDILKLDRDKIARKERLKNLPVIEIEITQKENGQQSNG